MGMILDGRKPEPEVLQEIIARVVQVAHPQRLILFGSAARGEMGPDSDVDLLVVVQDPVHRRDLAGKIYHHLHGVPVAVDVVVVTENDIREFGNKIGTVLYPALKEGVVVYEGNPSNKVG
jgi:predicted nucleotidyltransferase